jgi:Flp pilus assembly protein TadD
MALLRACQLLVLSAIVAGCASAPGVVSYSPDLLDGSAFGVAAGETAPDIDLLSVNDDMRAFLDRHVAEKASDDLKLRQLLNALIGDGLRLEYDNFSTFTAEEAFYTREANCMSFTNLFVALAREAGIKAYYQEVEIPPSWAERGDTWLYNLHLNVLVVMRGLEQVVDFNMADFEHSYQRRRITDAEAQAHYHNNMGVHRMTEGDYREAYLHYAKAIELQPGAGYIWNNLGLLYRRGGQGDAAEQAFLHAIAVDDDLSAASNLSRLYAQRGQAELARRYEEKVVRFRDRNPYYLYALAEQAYQQQRFSEAEDLLQRALRGQRNDHSFYNLLAMVHLQQGELGLAQRRFRQAQELADDRDRDRYSQKIARVSAWQDDDHDLD